MNPLHQRFTRGLMTALSVLMLAACATSYPPKLLVDKAAQAVRANEPSFEVAHSSAPVVLIGDNQENFNVGLPHIVINTGVDLFAAVTVRPPQQPLFGRQTLAYAIQETGVEPILHLGDIIDHSCETELEGIFELFNDAQRTGKPWAAIMGNHDGLFNGVLNQPSIQHITTFSSYGWRVRCRKLNLPTIQADAAKHIANDKLFIRDISDLCLEAVNFLAHPRFGLPGQPRRDKQLDVLKDKTCTSVLSTKLDAPLNSSAEAHEHPKIADFASSNVSKDQIIERYLAQLKQGSTFMDKTGINPFNDGRESFLLEATRPESFVQRVEGVVLNREPNCNRGSCPQFTRSYFIQSILLPQQTGTKKFRLLLLDTTHTGQEFDRIDATVWRSSPGDIGFVGGNQADQYAAEIERHKDSILIIGGHHPWGVLDKNSKERVAQAICRIKNPLIYLSAHTHNGFWAEHTIRCGSDSKRKLLELNISSLADWPIAFKRLSFEVNADASFIRVKAPNLPAAAKTLTSNESAGGSDDLLAAWQANVCTAVTEDIRKENRAALDMLQASDARSILFGTFFYQWRVSGSKRIQLYRSSLDVHSSSLRILSASYRDPIFAQEFSDISVGFMPAKCAEKLNASDALRCHSEHLKEAGRSGDVKRIVAEYDMATVVLEDFRRKLRAKESVGQLSKHSRNLMACLHVEAAHQDAVLAPAERNPVNNCQFIEQVLTSNVSGLGDELNNLCQNKRGELR